MSYFTAFGMHREPFSTSPDPAFFFFSEEHKAALRRLQIAISLRRGLCVIMGDVGTGKTTLSRRLSLELRDDQNVRLHMILNPYFKTEKQFLSRLAGLFQIDLPPRAGGLECMEAIEKFLFRCGVEEQKTIVLLIDEAQILPDFVFETLRILLNYETNEYKILQLVLLGQMELLPRISRMANFWDRIALRYVLNPLRDQEVRELVDFRLQQAGYTAKVPLFNDDAIRRIWQHTGGYPRKVALLCHNCLANLVMYDKQLVDAEIVDRLLEREVQPVQVAPESVADEHPAAGGDGVSLRPRVDLDAALDGLQGVDIPRLRKLVCGE